MITERPDIDLDLIKDKLLTDDNYTLDRVIAEIESWRGEDFLCLVSENDEIDGFMIGWRIRDYLWIYQIWHEPGTSIMASTEAMDMAKNWAKERGMTHLRGETIRKEMLAFLRYDWYEMAVIIRCDV